MADYILECSVNGRERLFRVSEAQGKVVQEKKINKSTEPFLINGMLLEMRCVVTVSPFDVWWEADRRTQANFSKQRCFHCLIIQSFGERCECQASLLERAGLISGPAASPSSGMSEGDRRRAWARSVTIMLLYPTISPWSFKVQGIMKRNNLRFEDLPEPKAEQIEAALANSNGRSRTLSEWREMVRLEKEKERNALKAQNEPKKPSNSSVATMNQKDSLRLTTGQSATKNAMVPGASMTQKVVA